MLLYLNQGAVWGWVVGGLLLVVTVLVIRRWTPGHRGLRISAWIVCTILLATTALGSHPSPQHRPVGGVGAMRSEVVHTNYGPVSGARTADGAVEVFAGVPYAHPPVGELRWRPPVPPRPWTEVRAATALSDVPVQPSSSFTTRALRPRCSPPGNSTTSPCWWGATPMRRR